MYLNYQIFKNNDYRMLIMYNVHQHGEQDDLLGQWSWSSAT